MIQPLFLVGARGSGKTTIGHMLANTVSFHFVDTDSYLLTSSGKTVAEIVNEEGWSGFRQRESRALERVCAPSTVVATGGGVVLAEDNRRFMAQQGPVIWLNVPAHILAERLDASPESAQRPALTEKSMTDEIVAVLAEREALYRQVANIIVDASQSPELIVKSIVNELHSFRVNRL